MNWILKITDGANKDTKRFPEKDLNKIRHALLEIEHDPFSGDIVELVAQPPAWRRRVGNYRNFFEIYPKLLLVIVTGIERRKSKTY